EHRRLVAALIAQLSRIEQPVLIVHPREDDCAHLDNAWYLQKQLKGMVEMVVLDDSYHMVTIDRQRHVVVDRTIGFMDRVVERLAIPAARAPQPLRARHA
ncbi:MAG: alpha/beta hydrolase, partial [Hyphomicrobiaceae bacterium]